MISSELMDYRDTGEWTRRGRANSEKLVHRLPSEDTRAHRPLMNTGTQSFAEYPIRLIDPRLDVIEVIELHRAALALYQPPDQSRAACCPG